MLNLGVICFVADHHGSVKGVLPQSSRIGQVRGTTKLAIAEQLFVSLAAVKWHARNIYDKLAVNNRTKAVARARELKTLA